MDDKKKKIVIGALLVAMLGIGAFQFTSGSSPEPAPVVEKKDEPAKQDQQKVAAVPNGIYVEPLAARDPFATAKLTGAVETSQNEPEPPKRTEPAPSKNTEFAGPVPEIDWDKDGLKPLDPRNGGVPGVQVQEPQFGYVLVGVLVGETPAAVFADAAGNQRLITVGSALDGDSKLVGVSQGKAVVKFGKKNITLTIGGTASAK